MKTSRRLALKMEKTILHLTCMRSTKYGGLEHYFVETARQCNRFSYKTVVQYDELPRSNVYQHDLNNLGVDIIALKLKLNPLKLAKLIYHMRPEVIHTHFANKVILFATPIIAKMLGAHKVIHTEHSMPSPSEISIVRRYAYNCYDKVICVSNAISEILSYAGVNQNILSTLYLGIFSYVKYSEELRHKFRDEFRISSQDKVLACIAFDTPFKGLDILLKSFQKVSRDRSDVHLIIIGVDPDRSQLPTMARDLGISGCVHWAGIRDEGWQVLTAADVYVQSSRFAEGLPLAIIEAMALKLPVVATRVAGVGEIVLDGENGLLCAPDDVDSLTVRMREMLSQPDQWDKMGEAGYKRYMEMLRGEKSVETLIQNYYFA